MRKRGGAREWRESERKSVGREETRDTEAGRWEKRGKAAGRERKMEKGGRGRLKEVPLAAKASSIMLSWVRMNLDIGACFQPADQLESHTAQVMFDKYRRLQSALEYPSNCRVILKSVISLRCGWSVSMLRLADV